MTTKAVKRFTQRVPTSKLTGGYTQVSLPAPTSAGVGAPFSPEFRRTQ